MAPPPERGVAALRFEFAYMTARRERGVRRPPPKAETLTGEYLDAVAQAGEGGRLLIGGKSMGGRIASLVAEEAGVAGLICLGYPFPPVGKPDRLRVDHLGPRSNTAASQRCYSSQDCVMRLICPAPA